MKPISFTRYLVVLTVGLLLVQACKSYYFRSGYQETNKLIHDTENIQTKPYLKAHLKNGGVCILRDSWVLDSTQEVISGRATCYDFQRKPLESGPKTIPLDSVLLFETNAKLQDPEKGRMLALSILAGLDVALGLICVAAPKACFGSCPTFYIDENDSFHYADAEGFSNAIAPSMEYGDIDALNRHLICDSSFSLTMKNEALETHCVNSVKLLAYPVKDNQRVYQSPDNDFYLCDRIIPLREARSEKGNISSYLRLEDRIEWFSSSDEHNLSSKEEIFLQFEPDTSTKNVGLVLNFRQSLMTTYFIYSAMGYMGDEVGDYFARMEMDAGLNTKLEEGIKKELGDVDVYLWDEARQSWVLQGGFYETGPIAPNRQFLPLSPVDSSAPVRLKIVLNKGLWRLDYAALARIEDQVQLIEVLPSEIRQEKRSDARALAKILSPEEHLISMPGSEYTFFFPIPQAGTDYELFLYSQGYYLEWMRENWIQEKNLIKLRQMVEKPQKYLKDEAAFYKQYETDMEQVFWNSKVDTKNFSYYEN